MSRGTPFSAVPLFLAVALALPAAASAQEAVDLGIVTRIRDEGLRHSQVMATVRQLTDVLGPRVTGSPEMKAANEWTRQRLEEWGLRNAHLEAYPFGRGWSFSRAAVYMLKPREATLFALPRAFTPGTAGVVRGPAMIVTMEKEADLEAYRGKVAGKILLLGEPSDLSKPAEIVPREHSAEDLQDLGRFEIPDDQDPEASKKRSMERDKFRQSLNRFLEEEKVLTVVHLSSRPWGIVRVTRGGSIDPAQSAGVPAVTMAAEHFNTLHRLLSAGQEVELEMDVQARFHDDPNAYNTLAEIPGTDRKGEVVMVGAHLDSWHGGTGATDNAAGSAVVMEAVRILQALGVKPRRTIRIALWSGEEQGLLGSRAYVGEHFGSWSGPEDPERRQWLSRSRWKGEGKLELRPDHDKLAAYFNVDNGGGRIRGIYAEENAAVRPIFEAWLEPLRDLAAGTVTLRHTGSTDHQAFLDVGLPGFQFIQDELDYSARTHHSHMDVYDHLERESLMQASVVVATFLYQAAMRPEKLPRPPLPHPSRP